MISVKVVLAVALQCGFTKGGILEVLGTAYGHPVVIWMLRMTGGRPLLSSLNTNDQLQSLVAFIIVILGRRVKFFLEALWPELSFLTFMVFNPKQFS